MMSEENLRNTDGVNGRLSRMAEISLEKGFKPFLSDFDPETSEREKRKLNQRLYHTNSGKRGSSYDENGIYIETNENLCDCLDRNCPGCHFPCPRCKSRKCGHECRSNRKWAYKSITSEGTNFVVENPNFKE